MKKLACILLTMMLMLGCAGAMAATYGDFEYSVTDGKVTITAYNGSAAEVTIPATIDGKPVTSIGSLAFYRCMSLTSVTIQYGVTSIGGSAFHTCKNLTSVTIPGSVTSIGASAFYRCTSLESVTIPDSVTSIGNYAFRSCTSLEHVEFASNKPEQITLGENTFKECPSDLQILVPVGTKEAYVKEFAEQREDETYWKALIVEKSALITVNLPRTGDASMLGAWILLLGASAAGMRLRRKNG